MTLKRKNHSVPATLGTAALAVALVGMCPTKIFAFTAITNAPPEGVVSFDAIGTGIGFGIPQEGIVFSTGSDPLGYLLSSFTPYLQNTSNDINQLTLSLYSTNTSNLPDTLLASDAFDLENYPLGPFELNSGNAPNVTSTTLAASTSYGLVLSRNVDNIQNVAQWANGSDSLYDEFGGFTHVSKIRRENGAWTTALGSNRVYTLDVTPVPAPLPLFGAAAAFGYSRKLRKRIKASKVGSAIG